MSSARTRFPRLTTRSALGWVIGTLVVVAGGAVYVAATQPENAPYAYGTVGLLVVAVVLVALSATWVDHSAGTVTWRRWAVVSTTVALREATQVAVVGSGPQALLRVRAGGRGGHLVLLVLSDYVQRSQSPQVLTALADTVAAHTAPGTSGEAVALLRAQAKHLTAGGDAATSPLARFTSKGLMRAAGGIGAAGGGLGNLG